MKRISLEEVALTSLKEYTYYVTKHRVLPALDLKPVHRRIIWSALECGARFNKGSFFKTATVVGNCLGLHPHGDASIEGAIGTLVNMPNSLLGHRGNWGARDGTGPAAARYTEVQTSELFESIFDEYMFDIGEFIPSYDDKRKEPVMIQTVLPLAPLIGCSGIGVGLTTSLPAFHIDFIKFCIKSELEKLPTPDKPVYNYGGNLLNNQVIPKLSIRVKDNREYLHLTELPNGCNIAIFNDSVIRELAANKIIDIIDNSTHDTLDIMVYAPKNIQHMIIQSCSRPILNNFKYYFKRLRSTEYYLNWCNERLRFIQRREYFKQSKVWLDYVTKYTLNELSKITLNEESTTNIAKECYNKFISLMPEESKEFIINEVDFVSNIKSRSIASVKVYSQGELSLTTFSIDRCKEILISEVESVKIPPECDHPTIPVEGIRYAKHSGLFKRYITFRNSGIEVKFSKNARVTNWETTEKVKIVYSDATTEDLPEYYFGIKEGTEKKVSGFMLPNKPLVIITESGKLQVLTRLTSIKEPIKICFSASKMLINEKEHALTNGFNYPDKVNTYKILEV